jgi:hypothetical protein
MAKKKVAKKAAAKKAAVKKVEAVEVEAVETPAAVPAEAFDTPAPEVEAVEKPVKTHCKSCGRRLADSNKPHTDGLCCICNPVKRPQKSVMPRV